MTNAQIAEMLEAAAYYVRNGRANTESLLDAISSVVADGGDINQRVAVDVLVEDYRAVLAGVQS